MYTIANLILSDRYHGNWENIMVRSHFGSLLQFAPTNNQNSVLLNAIVFPYPFSKIASVIADKNLPATVSP